jgi:hypothetical protein
MPTDQRIQTNIGQSPIEFSLNLTETNPKNALNDVTNQSLSTKKVTTITATTTTTTTKKSNDESWGPLTTNNVQQGQDTTFDNDDEVSSVISDDLGHALHSNAASAALLARKELVEAVDFFVEWKDALIQVHPLPNSALLPLLTTSSKLLRCRDVLKNNITTLANLAKSFANGLLSNDHINRLKMAKEEVTLKLSIEKMRRRESNYKLTSSLGLLRRYRDEIRYIRWSRLIFKVKQREQLKLNTMKLDIAQNTITNLKGLVNNLKNKCNEMESLQKATSSVAVKNQTKGDVLEKQMRKAKKRERKLTDMIEKLTTENASLSQLIKRLEKNEMERKEKLKRMKMFKGNDDDKSSRNKKGFSTLSQDGEWKEERKELVAKDIERSKNEKDEILQKQETLQLEKEQQLVAGTPLWQPRPTKQEVGKIEPSVEEQQQQQQQIKQNPNNIISPVARAARASSERRKAKQVDLNVDDDSDDEIDPWSAEAMTPPPTPYVLKKDEEQDNFTTAPFSTTFVSNGNLPTPSPRLEQKDMRKVHTSRTTNSDSTPQPPLPPSSTPSTLQQSQQQPQQSEQLPEQLPEQSPEQSPQSKQQSQHQQTQHRQKLQKPHPPPPENPHPRPRKEQPEHSTTNEKGIQNTTPILSTSDKSQNNPASNELVPVKLLVSIKQKHAIDIMKVQKHHDEQVNSLKLKLAQAEQMLNASKKEIKLLTRQCNKKRGKINSKYNGTPSFTTNGNNARRDFFAESNTTSDTTTNMINSNKSNKNNNKNNSLYSKSSITTEAWEQVETTPGRASRLSNKADITAGDPNVEDLLRYQKIAALSFQQNHESTISSNLSKHQNGLNGSSSSSRPKTTPTQISDDGSRRGRTISRNRGASKNLPYNQYHLAPDRKITDFALKEALKEDGPLRLPANFMPTKRHQPHRQNQRPRPPTTAQLKTRGGGGAGHFMNQINFSTRLYTKH